MKSKKHPRTPKRTPKETNELVRIVLTHLPAVIRAIAILALAVGGTDQLRPLMQEFTAKRTLKLMSRWSSGI
ncbi:hypothetical protein [Prosthecobacter fluviatilis]|uniref:Uncharacterized protein n=1 Tax=Prosthecobacter fluviatilis TaxID=445931 RepID=A0ABW0KYV6_9BACT